MTEEDLKGLSKNCYSPSTVISILILITTFLLFALSMYDYNRGNSNYRALEVQIDDLKVRVDSVKSAQDGLTLAVMENTNKTAETLSVVADAIKAGGRYSFEMKESINRIDQAVYMLAYSKADNKLQFMESITKEPAKEEKQDQPKEADPKADRTTKDVVIPYKIEE